MPADKNEKKTNDEKIDDVLIEFTEEEKQIDAKYQAEVREFKKRMGTRLSEKLDTDISSVEEPLWCEWTRTETTHSDGPSDKTLPYADGNREYTETEVVEHGFRSPLLVAALDAFAFAAPYPADPLADKRGESALSELIRQMTDVAIQCLGVYTTMKAQEARSKRATPPVPPPVAPVEERPCGCGCDVGATTPAPDYDGTKTD